MNPSVSLDDFRRIMGWHPWHYWGLADTELLKISSSCNDVVRKYPWQGVDAAGREDILVALRTSEERLAEYLGFYVGPTYKVHGVQWPKYHDRTLLRGRNMSAASNRIGVKMPKGMVQKVGYQRLTVINDTVAVTLSDEDLDGVDEVFTLTVATSVTDPDEIAVYFTAADRWDGSIAGDRWRVRPVRVSISGGTATIKGNTWLLVKPVLYEGVDPETRNPATAGVLATQLGVYRLWYDPNGIVAADSQGVLIWETEAHGWWCGCGSCSPATVPANSSQDPAAEAWAVARVGIRDSRLGIVTPAESVRDATSGLWQEVSWSACPEPDRVQIRYLSGIPLVDGQVDPFYQVLVCRMAAAELARPLCACDKANRELYTWQFDLSRARGANDEQFAISLDDIDNPFGTRRGHVFAWKEVSRRSLGVGIAV